MDYEALGLSPPPGATCSSLGIDCPIRAVIESLENLKPGRELEGVNFSEQDLRQACQGQRVEMQLIYSRRPDDPPKTVAGCAIVCGVPKDEVISKYRNQGNPVINTPHVEPGYIGFAKIG